MRRTSLAVLVLLLSSTPAWAQHGQTSTGSPIHAGSIVMGGGTSFTFTRMTFGASGDDVELDDSVDANATFFTSQAALTYYKSEHLGFGPVLAFMRFSFPAGESSSDTGISVSGGSFTVSSLGGLVKGRMPLNDRADFYVTAEGGWGRLASSNGYYLAGGAGGNIYLVERVAFNIGAQYQQTHINETTVSGLAVAAGFSVILR